MANAAATLAELQRRGWQQAVLSASRRDYLIEQVRARGLEDYFTELLGLQDIYGVSKVQVGKDWLRNSGVDPAACVMVGDTTHDAEVAAAKKTEDKNRQRPRFAKSTGAVLFWKKCGKETPMEMILQKVHSKHRKNRGVGFDGSAGLVYHISV